mgnify:FL=1
MNTRHLIQKIGMAGAVALAAASCTQDDLTGGRGTNGNAIGFGITTLAENTAEGRASEADDKPIVLPFPGGRDTLYLHPWAEENRSVPSAPQKGETRGVPVTTEEDFKDVCGSFGVTAYTDDGRLFMPNEKVTSASGNLWTTGETYFWPAEETLNFYAYAPYSSTGDGYGDNMTINQNAKNITFSHTVPDQATAQPDILFTHKACSKATSNGGTVSLRFHHALAGVKFVAKNVTNCTVTSITLRGLYGQGSCTYDAATGTFTWELTGEKRIFSEDFNVELTNSEGETTQPITDVNKATTFMMIPQTLEGVTVEVGVTTSEGEFTLTGSLAQTGEWEAGKIYTYAISTESINWVYVFDVTPENDGITLPLGETQGTYNVKSYRFRRGNYNEKEPVAWSAVNTACTETDFETNQTENKNWNDIRLAFTDTGAGSADEAGTNHSIQVIETILHTTYDDDKQLQDESKAKGTPEKPYNLATDNGEDGAMTTANCYVVNAVGTYKLPLVYGNGLKNGAKNNPAFNGNFKDYQNNTITDPWIKGTDNCCLVWSDGFYMFKNVHKEDDYLVFTLDPNYTQQANAVLAVRDASNNIMWSWHIWVTERNVNATHDVEGWNESTHYYLMPCNLGWIDGKQVYYNQRNFAFTFTQNGTGTVRTLNVVQKGDHFDYKDAGSTYYQWGRKDPLVALKNRELHNKEDYRLHEVGQDGYGYRTETKTVSLGEAIQHPNVFYTTSNTYYCWLSNPIYNLWNTNSPDNPDITNPTKTLYDPSPRGFKIPPSKAFARFVNGNAASSGGTLNGRIVTPGVQYEVCINSAGTTIPLTATGQRVDRTSGIDGIEEGGLWAMDGVYYWTCYGVTNSIGTILGHSLCIRDGANTYTYQFPGAQTMARPVRPIADR